MEADFKFLDPGKLIDNELELVLIKKNPADDTKGFSPAYEFEMRNSESGERMGYIHLRIGDTENLKYGGNIGYGVEEKFRGKHYATRSCKLLLLFAVKNGQNPIWITTNPDNIASQKSAELAGFKFVETVDLPEYNDQYKLGFRQKCRYKIDINKSV